MADRLNTDPTIPDDKDNVLSKLVATARNALFLQKTAIITYLSAINFISSAANGLFLIGLPTITKDLQLLENIIFWPLSIGGLTTASALLPAGSVADIIGSRYVNLTGCLINGLSMASCALCQRGELLVVLRGLQGIGLAMHFSTSVALVAQTVPHGRGRNISFSCLGLAQPLGFSFGLVIGGLIVEAVGWRFGCYLYGSLTLLLTIFGYCIIQKPVQGSSSDYLLRELRSKVDWVGSFLVSASLALISYYLAVISTGIEQCVKLLNVIVLCFGFIALILFICWAHYRCLHKKPPLIPNSIWLCAPFTSICLILFIAFAVVSSMELFSNLFFQQLQQLSPVQAAICILPSLLFGIVLNLATGLFMHKAPIWSLVFGCSLLTAGAPLLMAINEPHQSYWAYSFPSQLLMPISCDVVFTIGLIIISDTFTLEKQAVAGAVFNASIQLGNSFGIAVMQTISTLVIQNSHRSHAEALLDGYRACFWAMVVLMVFCTGVSGLGLRNISSSKKNIRK